METILDLQARILAKLEGRDRNEVLVELNEILKKSAGQRSRDRLLSRRCRECIRRRRVRSLHPYAYLTIRIEAPHRSRARHVEALNEEIASVCLEDDLFPALYPSVTDGRITWQHDSGFGYAAATVLPAFTPRKHPTRVTSGQNVLGESGFLPCPSEDR